MTNEKASVPVTRIIVSIICIVLVVVTAFWLVNPPFVQQVKNKLFGNLTPARDLTGTWVSSIPGKGIDLFGQFNVEGSNMTIVEDGNITLVIDRMEDNKAYGTLRYTDLCASGTGTAPNGMKVDVPMTCIPDSGEMPVTINVSSSAVDFGTLTFENITATMNGSFTTDIMSGPMTMSYPPYGNISGSFHLSRQRE